MDIVTGMEITLMETSLDDDLHNKVETMLNEMNDRLTTIIEDASGMYGSESFKDHVELAVLIQKHLKNPFYYEINPVRLD
jgi:predicted methyltransferase